MKHQLKVYEEDEGCENRIVIVDDLVQELVALSNDIDQYLQSDAPLECYRNDIGQKIQSFIFSLSHEQQKTIWDEYNAQAAKEWEIKLQLERKDQNEHR